LHVDIPEFERKQKDDLDTQSAELEATTGKLNEDLVVLHVEIPEFERKQKDATAARREPTITAAVKVAIRELLELKPTCVDIGMSYEERVARREDEIESLKTS